ncbi:hypothetical protein D3C71_2066740 [compost metagenome]
MRRNDLHHRVDHFLRIGLISEAVAKVGHGNHGGLRVVPLHIALGARIVEASAEDAGIDGRHLDAVGLQLRFH